MHNMDLSKILNKLAKAEILPTTLNGIEILPEHNAMCSKTWLEISAAGGTPTAAFAVLIRKIQGLRSFLLDFCNPNTPTHFGGEGGLDDRVGDIMCVMIWLNMRGFFPSSAVGGAFSILGSLVHGIGSNPTLSAAELKAFCVKMKTLLEHMPITNDEWVEIFSPNITLSPIPTTCPQSWADQVTNSLPQVYQDNLEAIRVALAVLAGLIAGAVLALMAALAAGVPAFIANSAYAITVASARAVAIAALMALGVTSDDASAAADELENGIKSCDTVDPTDIGVEEEEKGEGCCLEGEIVDGIENQDDCLNIGGDWGGIDQMGCISLPGDVK